MKQRKVGASSLVGRLSSRMRNHLGHFNTRKGQGYLEGFLALWVMLIFVFAIYALGSLIWAKTFAETTTAFATQQALIAYDRGSFGGRVRDSYESGLDTTAAMDNARDTAEEVLNSVTDPAPGAFSVLRIDDVGCEGVSTWDPTVSVSEGVDASGIPTITVSVSTNARWRLGGLYTRCIRSTHSITSTKR